MRYSMIPYIKNQQQPRLGEGYQITTGEILPVLGIKDPQKDPQPFLETNVEINYVSELREVAVTINGSLGLSTPPIPPGISLETSLAAKFGYNHSQSHIYAVVMVDQSISEEKLLNPKLSDAAKRHLANNEMMLFYSKCGDAYISSVRYGKKLIAILQLDTDRKEIQAEVHQKTKVSAQVASADAAVDFVMRNLSDTKILRNKVYAVGSNQSWSFGTYDELAKEMKEHMISADKSAISYEVESYVTTEDFEEAHRAKLTDLSNQVKVKVSNLYQEAEKYFKKINPYYDDDSNNQRCITLCNTHVNRFNDAKYKVIQNNKPRIKENVQKLQNILSTLKNGKQIIDDVTFTQFEKDLRDVKNWYSNIKDELKDAGNHAYLHSVSLKNPKLDFVIPAAINKNMKYLFFQLTTKNNVIFTLEKERNIFINAPVVEKLSGAGTYIDRNVAGLSKLMIRVPKSLAKQDLTLNIYAAEKQLKGYANGDLTEHYRRRLHPKLDGAAAEEYVEEHEIAELKEQQYESDQETESEYVDYEINISDLSNRDGDNQYLTYQSGAEGVSSLMNKFSIVKITSSDEGETVAEVNNQSNNEPINTRNYR